MEWMSSPHERKPLIESGLNSKALNTQERTIVQAPAEVVRKEKTAVPHHENPIVCAA